MPSDDIPSVSTLGDMVEQMLGTTCHQKPVQLAGAILAETILFPVPHRQTIVAIAKVPCPYFRDDGGLCNLELYFTRLLPFGDGFPCVSAVPGSLLRAWAGPA
jgi:hypothetical protein